MDDMLDDLITALSWSGIVARKSTSLAGQHHLRWRFSGSDTADWLLFWDGVWQLDVDDPVRGDGEALATILKATTVATTHRARTDGDLRVSEETT